MRLLRLTAKVLLALVALVGIALLALYLKTQSMLAVAPYAPQAALLPGHVAEGARLARIMGCRGCHTDSLKGGDFLREPYVFRLVAPNLTHARAKYDDAAWLRLFRTGAKRDGHLAVGMPIAGFQRLTDQDIANLVAFVRSVPTVDNSTLGTTHLYPLARVGLLTGKFRLEDIAGDAPDTPQLLAQRITRDRGEHIALTTCTECHGRTLAGSSKMGAPPLGPMAHAYGPSEFARLLHSGKTLAGTESATGLMSEVARGRFAALTDTEVAELHRYLQAR